MFGEDVFSEYEEIVKVHTTNKELENKIKELENNNGYKKRILGKLKRILSK